MQNRTRTGVSLIALGLVVAFSSHAALGSLVLTEPSWLGSAADPILASLAERLPLLGFVLAGFYGVLGFCGSLLIEADRRMKVLTDRGAPDRPRLALAFASFAGLAVAGLGVYVYPEYIPDQAVPWALRFVLEAGIAIAIGLYLFWTAVRLSSLPIRRAGLYALSSGTAAGVLGPLSNALVVWGPITGGIEGNRAYFDTVAALSIGGFLASLASLSLWLFAFLRIRAEMRASPVSPGYMGTRA